MAHIRVAWATPIDPAAKGEPLAIRWPSKARRFWQAVAGLALPIRAGRPGRERRPDSPSSPTRQITAASPLAAWRVTPVCRAMDSALLAKGRARNDESPAWRPGLSNLWKGAEARKLTTPNLPRFPETVNSKTLFLRAGALGPSTAAARRADPATGTAMEPLQGAERQADRAGADGRRDAARLHRGRPGLPSLAQGRRGTEARARKQAAGGLSRVSTLRFSIRGNPIRAP
jgi:hypothetical protein